MIIQSLSYRTDLFFPRFDAEVIARGDCLVVRTPANPTFWWGNFLLFPKPPAAGDLPRWERLFAQEVGTPLAVRHVAFGLDGVAGATGEIAPFLEAGYIVEESVVLTAREVSRPDKYSDEIAVRALTEEWEWQAALDNRVACREDEHDEESYRVFAARQMQRYRAMAAAGCGDWFGAFLGDRLVGGLGLFVEDGVGRFQAVGTHPDFRRRGVCGTLVYQAARHALTAGKVQVLIMVADPDYHAARIYENVGFAPAERQVGLLRQPR